MLKAVAIDSPTIEGLDFIKEEINQGHLLKNKGRPYMVVFLIEKIVLFG